MDLQATLRLIGRDRPPTTLETLAELARHFGPDGGVPASLALLRHLGPPVGPPALPITGVAPPSAIGTPAALARPDCARRVVGAGVDR